MRILIASLNFYPELTGIGLYSFDFSKFLVKQGHKVEVLTTFPYYPQWQRHAGYDKKFFFNEVVEGVNIYRCFTYIPQSPSALQRILHEGIFAALVLLRGFFFTRPDLLICVSPPFLAMVAIAIVSRARNIPFHIHAQDLQPDAAIDLGMLSGRVLIKFLYFIERFCYKTASLISAIGEGMIEKIESKGVPKKKLFLFSNWVNFEDINAAIQLDDSAFRKPHNLEGKYVVLHSGNIGEKQGLETLLDAAWLSQQNDDNIQFLIVGDGVRRKNLEKKAAVLELKNIKFLDVQSKKAFFEMLVSVDISVIMQKRQVRDTVVPSKLLNILAVGLPLIACVDRKSETARILQNLTEDVLVEPENAQALYRKISYFRKMPHFISDLREEEKELARRWFDKSVILPQVMSRIERIVNPETNRVL